MLRTLIEREMYAERRADYAANMLWTLTGAFFTANGGKLDLPSWGSLADDSPPEADLTGEEIRENLLKRWGGGG